MRGCYLLPLRIFLILFLLLLQFTIGFKIQDWVVSDKGHTKRRILHQPLFPETSPPSSVTVSPPPPPPPQPPAIEEPDHPFFPQVPPSDQSQQSPPVQTNVSSNSISSQSQQSKPVKNVAIALSVGIVTLGMLSALAFYLYKHRAKQADDSHKLVGRNNSQTFNEESRMPPPSTFLYIGTVEPSSQRSSILTETNANANSSPYRKLSSTAKRSDRYRPSPDLQPLPPLSKPPPPPPTVNSPPPMSSSDDESQDTAFYTPQGSTVSNEERAYLPFRNQSFRTSSPVPHSKRTSPKPRLPASIPDVKHTLIPSIKQSPAPHPPPPPPQSEEHRVQLQSSKPGLQYTSKRPKFAPPPPPPDMARLQAITNTTQPLSKPPIPPPPLPPPPPPPPPPMLTPRKLGTPRTNTSSSSPTPRTTPESLRRQSSEEVSGSSSSAERHDGDDNDGSKPKLKPLHWDKVPASSDRATVWDQLKSSSFQLNEDMMETLFGFNSANSAPKDSAKKSVLPRVEKENRVLDPKKSQNIAILLRALNVTRDEVSEALLEGNPEGLGPELLETLVKMAPTKEEEIKLREYSGDIAKLGSAERFLKAILDVPFAFKRVEAMLYRANFDTEVKYLRSSFQTLEEACIELKNSRLFLKLLEAVLRTGNRMNVGTNRGDARAFKLDTLLKLVDVKGTDGKTTLLHFVVQEIIRAEGASSDPMDEPLPNKAAFDIKEEGFKKQGLQIVAGLTRELNNVKKAAGMDSDVLHSYVSKLENGLEKVTSVLQHEKENSQGKFFESMRIFLKEAREEIEKIKSEERNTLSLVREVTQYFHGDAAKEEAHPFRIFMIVRDFLSILDNVCKDVGKMQERTMVGTARPFRIAATAPLPVLNRYTMYQHKSPDTDSSSPSNF